VGMIRPAGKNFADERTLLEHTVELDRLRAFAGHGPVTSFGARDEQHNDAVVVRYTVLPLR